MSFMNGGSLNASRRNPIQGTTTALPKSLIGASFPELNPAITHKKSHAFVVSGNSRNVASVATKGKPGELDVLKFKNISSQKIHAAHPEWETLTKKTLRFFGYYKEPVHEKAEESERVRKVVLLYYLEDDTMQVSEPRIENSGINQGSLLKRHKVLKPDSDEFYVADDLNVGALLTFYGKTMVICDCDAATRLFFEKLGCSQGDALPYPRDAHQEWRVAHSTTGPKDIDLRRVMDLDASQRTGGTIHKISADERESSRAFFEGSSRVLRYYCKRADPVPGEDGSFQLLFFQVDGTVVISEEVVPNSGKDPCCTFLKRRKLPKPCGTYNTVSVETISQIKDATVSYYGEDDFGIGRHVSVFGRDLVICDMDGATKKHHIAKGNGGCESGVCPDPIVLSGAPKQTKTVREPPAYNGFGSEEDSLGSWTNLVLKPPKRDCAKELKERDNVLRFGCEMVSKHPTDKGRKFVLSYYLGDNTMQLYEHLAPNSGLVGGKFLSRQRVRVSPPGMPAVYLQPQDLFLGASVVVNSSVFLLTETDQRTVALMEGHEKIFTAASVQEILKKLRGFIVIRHSQIAEAFRYFDKDHSGCICASELKQILTEQQLEVSDHEVMTLMRYFDTNGDGLISYKEFVDRMIPNDHSGELDADRGVVELTEVETDVTRYEDAQRMIVNKRTASKAFKLLADKLVARNLVAQDTFRCIARSTDSPYIPEQAFRDSISKVFQLQLPEHEVDALVWKFFYDPKTNTKRTQLSLPQFIKVLEGAPGVVQR